MGRKSKDGVQVGQSVAVVGLDSWYPGADSLSQFWENILAKRQQFRRLPDQRLPLALYHSKDRNVPDKTYGTEAAVIDGFAFDWQDRRIPKKVVEATDIVHWLALEVALKALESSRLDVARLQKLRTGVILGNTLTGEWTRTNAMRMRWPFFERVMMETAMARGLTGPDVKRFVESVGDTFKSVFPDVTEDTLAGALSNTIAGRICNFLDLHGGGYTVDGACSSSLIAVITAARNVAHGELDVAFAGGIDVSLDTFELIGFAKTGALTPDEMRVYDRRANGFIPGEGCGFVILKRLEDAERDGDPIFAVLQGWGISSDGKGGLTAPTAEGQAQAIGDAYRLAGYGLSKVDFVEGHGTGTTVGDKIEISGLVRVLAGEKPGRPIALTSLKSIVGHTKAAAGIGALIKAVIGVNQRVIPPMAGVEEPNPIFSAEAKDFYPAIEGEVRPPDQVIRAGVSAMGFGGINSHVTLESYGPPAETLAPTVGVDRLLESPDKKEALVISGRTQAALIRQVERLTREVSGLSRAELTDLAADLAQRARPSELYRAVVLAGRPDEAMRGLTKVSEWLREPLREKTVFEETEAAVFAALGFARTRPRIAFLFPGQGAQKVNMGRRLIRRHGFARLKVREADGIFRSRHLGESLSELMLRPLHLVKEEDSKKINQTEFAQPAITLVNALWYEYLEQCGVRPDIVAGHSLGELTALYAGGAFDFATLVKLATSRGELMAHQEERPGSMIYLTASCARTEELLPGIPGYLTVANINAPDQTVLSGDPSALQALLEKARSEGVQGGFLPVSNAFHSRYMDDAAAGFAKVVAACDVPSKASLRRPFVKGTTGETLSGLEDLGHYLSRQIVEPVQFIKVMDQLRKSCDLLIEVGPGAILTGLWRKYAGTELKCFPVEAKPEADGDFKVALAACFVRGLPVKWAEIYRERFFRPFVPYENRVFIESPTERPLLVKDRTSLSPTFAVDGVNEAISAPFEPKRGPRAHIAASSSSTSVGGEDILPLARGSEALPKGSGTSSVDPSFSISSDVSAIETAILSLIAEQTGFEGSSLKTSQRLLDDLNLDSIKVTDLVGQVSVRYGIAGDLSSAAFANATVHELALAIKERVEAKGGGLKGAPGGDEAKIEAGGLGSPKDLDRSTLSRGETRPLALAPAPAPAGNGAEPKMALVSKSAEGADVAEVSRSHNRPAWVRNFTEVYRIRPMVESGTWDWAGQRVLCLGLPSDAAELGRFAESLTGLGAIPSSLLVEGHGTPLLDLKNIDLVTLFMPHPRTSEDRDDRSTIALLSGVAKAAWTPRHTLLFVQFDDGHFGQKGASGRLHSAKAFAQSLAQERSDLRVLALSFHQDLEEDYSTILRCMGRELGQPKSKQESVLVGIDSDGQRLIPHLELDQPRTYRPRGSHCGPGDVVLVTGGAKGITAASALAFAETYRTVMVLVGSSPFTERDQADPSHPVTETLRLYREKGLKAHYLSCDLVSEEATQDLVQKVRSQIGHPVALIHGAGVNYPRPASTVDVEQAMREFGPKVVGLRHLLSALGGERLRLIVGLTSVIGVVGMPGNAWYGFANESLDLMLRAYSASAGQGSILTLAYSVWSDVGMGARMGSDKNLEAKGIGSIPVSEGVGRFMHLVTHEGRDQQTIITSRLGRLRDAGGAFRGVDRVSYPYDFAKNLLHLHPGVEAIARIKLTLSDHDFLRDHSYRGAYLMPTVMGLEAMAQVAQTMADLSGRPSLELRAIKLLRPITVGSQGTDIEIYAECMEDRGGLGDSTIRAGIRTALTGYRYDHFAVEFVLRDLAPESVSKIPGQGRDLGIRPLEQLYGGILFQGPLFQRIRKLEHLESDNETEGCLVFEARSQDGGRQGFILGDPFVRDALLQSAQIVIPQNQCLPIEIESIELFPGFRGDANGTRCFTQVKRVDAKSYAAHVLVYDEKNRLMQRMRHYKMQFVEKRPQYPKAMDLIPQASRTIHQEGVGEGQKTSDLLAPYLRFSKRLMIDAEANGPQGQSVFVHRFIPDFKSFANLSRSIYFSHFFNWMGWAREMSSMPVLDQIRSLTESGQWGLVTNWANIEVLGECRNRDRVVEARMWCGRISGSMGSTAVLTFDWVSRGEDGIEERIATGRMGFTWVEIYGHGLVRPAPFPEAYREFIGLMSAQFDAPDTFLPAKEPYRSLSLGEPLYAAKVGPSGGILMGEKTFETSLFDANLVGNLYFGNYSIWMGKLRDTVFFRLSPRHYRGIGQDGEFTCVSSRIQHLREAMPFDDIHVTMGLRTWYANGLDLTFEFYKKMPDGKLEKLAMGEHRMVWTVVDERGERHAKALPEEIVREIRRLVDKDQLGAVG